MKIQELRAYAEHITREDLQQLEAMLDQLYSRVGIDVELNRTHFFQRVNDPRNAQPITINELSKLFKGAFQKYSKKLAQMGHDVEAVLFDIQTKVNVPFALEWDQTNQELDLIAKSAMRNKNYQTRDRMLRV